MHRITQMEYPVALDDQLGILEHQASVSDRPEVWLPRAEDDRHDVDRHMVDEPQRQRLPADLTRAHTNLPLASQLVCSRDSLLHRGGEVVRRLRVPARRPRSVRHEYDIVARRRVALPPVGRARLATRRRPSARCQGYSFTLRRCWPAWGAISIRPRWARRRIALNCSHAGSLA